MRPGSNSTCFSESRPGMRLSAHDDYGLRLLLRIARGEPGTCMTTAVLADREGMTTSHAGKVLRLLRQAGFVEATRGNCGGYSLTRSADEIAVTEVLTALGGRLSAGERCADHVEGEWLCTESVECAVRSLWAVVQERVDMALSGVTLGDMVR